MVKNLIYRLLFLTKGGVEGNRDPLPDPDPQAWVDQAEEWHWLEKNECYS